MKKWHTYGIEERVDCMSQLGERLRAAREGQGISIAQAALETRILQRYLVALEESDYQHLPGDVYARGFIRNYANYLGLSAEELIELYRRERGVSEPIRVRPATSAPRIRSWFVPSFFGVFFVVLALVAVSYILLNVTNNLGESKVAQRPTDSVATPTPLPTSIAAPTSAPELASGQTAAPVAPLSEAAGGAAPTLQPSATAQLDAPIVFEVRIQSGASSGSWLSIEADGAKVFQKILKPEDAALQVKAQRKITMTAGNAGVVLVTVNGKDQGQLGGEGEVVKFTWPPQ